MKFIVKSNRERFETNDFNEALAVFSELPSATFEYNGEILIESEEVKTRFDCEKYMSAQKLFFAATDFIYEEFHTLIDHEDEDIWAHIEPKDGIFVICTENRKFRINLKNTHLVLTKSLYNISTELSMYLKDNSNDYYFASFILDSKNPTLTFTIDEKRLKIHDFRFFQ